MHTFDQFVGVAKAQNKYLIEGIAKHMIYHRCALKVSKYEIVIQDDHLEQYMANKHLAQFVKEGWLVFLIKGYQPARLNFGNCNWQGLYENMALLRYWRSKKHVMFWNADEYLVYNRSFTPVSSYTLLLTLPLVNLIYPHIPLIHPLLQALTHPSIKYTFKLLPLRKPFETLSFALPRQAFDGTQLSV